MKKIISIIILMQGIFLLNAQTLKVPSHYNTIQAAIDSATDGDTVLVDEGTYYENINFLGKPITVASQFIIDGDTSHISKTIIDGSQAGDLLKASTVTMESGEDTTSVIMGFTITGGTGTNVKLWNWDFLCGGGIMLSESGGKILHNIVEENRLNAVVYNYRLMGAGMTIWVKNPGTAIIRDNIIRNNSCDSSFYVVAGGVMLIDGLIHFEANRIHHNIVKSSGSLYALKFAV